MSNQDFGRDPSTANRNSEGLGQRTTKAASDAFSVASAMAGETAAKAKQVASDTAATVTDQSRVNLPF
jgi:hypothetical protein